MTSRIAKAITPVWVQCTTLHDIKVCRTPICIQANQYLQKQSMHNTNVPWKGWIKAWSHGRIDEQIKSPTVVLQNVLPNKLPQYWNKKGLRWTLCTGTDFVTNSYGESWGSSCEQIMRLSPRLKMLGPLCDQTDKRFFFVSTMKTKWNMHC